MSFADSSSQAVERPGHMHSPQLPAKATPMSLGVQETATGEPPNNIRSDSHWTQSLISTEYLPSSNASESSPGGQFASSLPPEPRISYPMDLRQDELLRSNTQVQAYAQSPILPQAIQNYQNTQPIGMIPSLSATGSSVTGREGYGYATGPAFNLDYWSPNILSTINWLSDDVPMGYQDDLILPFSSLPLQDRATLPPRNSSSFTNTTHVPSSSQANHLQTASHLSGQSHVRHRVQEGSPTSYEIASRPGSSHAETPRSGEGEYYVDGDEARLPKVKRRKLGTKDPSRLPPIPDPRATLRFPFVKISDLGRGSSSLTSPLGRHKINDEVYNEMSECFVQVCVHHSAIFDPFETSDFPDKATFEVLLTLYFEMFHQTLPLLHPSLLQYGKLHWVLYVAIAAIGSHFLEIEEAKMFSTAIHEYLRRAILRLVSILSSILYK